MNKQCTFLAAVMLMAGLMAATPPGKPGKRLPRPARSASKVAVPKTPAPSSADFQSLLTGYYEDYLKLNPSRTSYMGDYRYNDQLENALS